MNQIANKRVAGSHVASWRIALTWPEEVVDVARRTSPVLLRRQLGDELRRHREAAGEKAGDVAKALGVQPAAISRLENGQRRPMLLYVAALCDHYGLDRETTEQLKGLARAAHQEGWWEKWNTADPWESAYAGFEAGASVIKSYELGFVPGLLQTADYTRAVVIALLPEISQDALEKNIEFRARRQDVLVTADPVELHAIISENVLRTMIGDPDVMRGQMIHLREQMKLPNVKLQVLPFTAGSAISQVGSFTVLEFSDGLTGDIVHTETALGTTAERGKKESVRCKSYFTKIAAAAADEETSIRIIEALL
ncbi:helix-turn-helix transcriptional regulator [Actinoplanes sp. NPDC051861]|uniref:helix-turn-helix domain-containing protein n=1 Tax=Actinoplanes sp. NPDC051861 TaxID=3155170 RepID=UPI003437B7E0